MSAQRDGHKSAASDAAGESPLPAAKSMPTGLENLRYAEDDGVGLLTIDRPAVYNAISLATMDELDRVLDWLENGSQAGALVVTGAGERVFVSGGDLKDFESLTTYDAAAAMSRRMQHLMARLSGLRIPVIGAINGDCLGGGCEFALATDIRIVSEGAHFGFKQVTLGITPAWGGRGRLVRLIGRSRTLMLLLSGDLIDATEARRIGLADRVTPAGEVLAAALELARSIARNPRGAVEAIKRTVNHDEAAGGEDAIEFEADVFARTWISEDHYEALAARKEKRAPKFRGR